MQNFEKGLHQDQNVQNSVFLAQFGIILHQIMHIRDFEAKIVHIDKKHRKIINILQIAKILAFAQIVHLDNFKGKQKEVRHQTADIAPFEIYGARSEYL